MQSPERQLELAATLEIGPGSCVAIIGAGGKSTVMERLSAELEAAKQHYVLTTTTKFWPPDTLRLLLPQHNREAVVAVGRERQRGKSCALGHHLTDKGKVAGVDPSLVCELLAAGYGPILIEADGAASRPLKAHGPDEPVVPRCSTDLLVVAGLDAIGRQADDQSVHRAAEYERVTGSALGTIISPADVASALAEAARHAPTGTRVVFVLNKVDDQRARDDARRTVEELRRSSPSSCVAATSRGLLLEWWEAVPTIAWSARK